MPRYAALLLLLALVGPVVAQDRGTIWNYDSLPPSLSIADIESRLGAGFDGFFGHEDLECRTRSKPGSWMLASATTEPYAYFYVSTPDVIQLLVAAQDSVVQYRVELGRQERLTHGEGSYMARASIMDDAQYRALASLAEEALAWCG